MERKLYRVPERGMLTGLCAGLAEYFKTDVTIVRLLAVLAIFITSGFFILVYFIAAIVVPTKDSVAESDYMNERVNSVASDLKKNASSSGFKNWLGIGLILLGIWLTLRVIWPEWFDFRWDIIWPAALIFVGIIILTKGRK